MIVKDSKDNYFAELPDDEIERVFNIAKLAIHTSGTTTATICNHELCISPKSLPRYVAEIYRMNYNLSNTMREFTRDLCLPLNSEEKVFDKIRDNHVMCNSNIELLWRIFGKSMRNRGLINDIYPKGEEGDDIYHLLDQGETNFNIRLFDLFDSLLKSLGCAYWFLSEEKRIKNLTNLQREIIDIVKKEIEKPTRMEIELRITNYCTALKKCQEKIVLQDIIIQIPKRLRSKLMRLERIDIPNFEKFKRNNKDEINENVKYGIEHLKADSKTLWTKGGGKIEEFDEIKKSTI